MSPWTANMPVVDGDWSAQQLVDFLAAVTRCRDQKTAMRTAVDVATEIFEAELGAVVLDGEVPVSLGFPAGKTPEGTLVDIASGAVCENLHVPGVGRTVTAVAPFGHGNALLVARPEDDPLQPAEVATLRGMAGVLALVLETLRTVDVERELRQVHQQALDDAVHRASHDELTGLGNRQAFHDRLDSAVVRRVRSPGGAAVLFVDLDDFKTVNDSLGHSFGDVLLVQAAQRIRDSVRDGDTASRLGGDEFAVLLEGVTGPSRPIQVAERLLRAFVEPFQLDGQSVFVNASVGIAIEETGSTTEEILRAADLAMYEAKRQGKGRYAVYEAKLSESMLHRISLEADMRRALREEQFWVVYQPVVATQDGATLGFEALVRWARPGHGTVPPMEFIPLAEETGMVVPLDRWVLRRACAQVREWQDAYGDSSLSLSVNLSARHLHLDDVVADTEEALATSGLAPSCLTLEITETALLLDNDVTRVTISGLKDLGVRIAIDDFGTGYSSLSYLRRFRVDALKIDRSFVEALDDHSGDEPLVHAIIQLASTLGLSVVAEGVETQEQLSVLRTLGCDIAQGYFFDKPLDAEAAGARLQRGHDASGTLTGNTSEPPAVRVMAPITS
jgi:diguanylate cyclase (GGDEF)-like protein